MLEWEYKLAVMPYWNKYADRERAMLIKGGLYGIDTLQLLFWVKNAKELSKLTL
ncbi:MAG: hypothetical protein QXH39_06050 [Conexivisphaerales archaeon]